MRRILCCFLATEETATKATTTSKQRVPTIESFGAIRRQIQGNEVLDKLNQDNKTQRGHIVQARGNSTLTISAASVLEGSVGSPGNPDNSHQITRLSFHRSCMYISRSPQSRLVDNTPDSARRGYNCFGYRRPGRYNQKVLVRRREEGVSLGIHPSNILLVKTLVL
jgi:hypothetical protein